MVASATGSSGEDRRRQGAELGKASAGEIASTKMSMMPPQVRPTVKASSSETPYRCSTAARRVAGEHRVASSYTAPSTQPPETEPTAVPSGPDQHGGAGRARRGPEGADHGADADGLAGLPPAQQIGQHFAHGGPPARPCSLAAYDADPAAAGSVREALSSDYDPFAAIGIRQRLLWVDDRCRAGHPTDRHRAAVQRRSAADDGPARRLRRTCWTPSAAAPVTCGSR